MTTVLLIIHIMIALAMIGLVLLQRSEGGALGIGGGGGGGFMTGRGAANFLTRATAGLAAAFFATSLLLSLIAAQPTRERSIFDQPGPTAPAKRPTSLPQVETTPPPTSTKPPADATPPAPQQAPTGPRVPQSK